MNHGLHEQQVRMLKVFTHCLKRLCTGHQDLELGRDLGLHLIKSSNELLMGGAARLILPTSDPRRTGTQKRPPPAHLGI